MDDNIVILLAELKCLPVLLYGCECFGDRTSVTRQLNFVWSTIFYKLWGITGDNAVYVMGILGIKLPSITIADRCAKFINKLGASVSNFSRVIKAVLQEYGSIDT